MIYLALLHQKALTMRDYKAEVDELEKYIAQFGVKTENRTLMEMMYDLITLPNSTLEKLNEPVSSAIVLSEDQEKAWLKIQAWTETNEPYFILRGHAGTGKSTTIKLLADKYTNIYFSATTNKAAKVLSSFIGKQVRTIYSLLGLKMVEEEDKLVLKQRDNPPYFPKGAVIVVDECSMIGFRLQEAIEDARKRCNLKILYVGDPAQLNPIGESHSLIWRLTQKPECRVLLTQVMRNDSQLLKLATRIRKCLIDYNYESPLKDDHNTTGVFKFRSAKEFESHLLRRVKDIDLHETKVIAWRNKTVEHYNSLIRNVLGYKEKFEVGDIILLAEPIEINGNIIAHTDDEYTIKEVVRDVITIFDDLDAVQIDTWRLNVAGDQDLILQIPARPVQLQSILAQKANKAKRSSKQERIDNWRDFWDTKHKFNAIRYGYALTAHRAQGSTYKECYVDQMDILCNSAQREAFRCLYVACSRPTTNVYSY